MPRIIPTLKLMIVRMVLLLAVAVALLQCCTSVNAAGYFSEVTLYPGDSSCSPANAQKFHPATINGIGGCTGPFVAGGYSYSFTTTCSANSAAANWTLNVYNGTGQCQFHEPLAYSHAAPNNSASTCYGPIVFGANAEAWYTVNCAPSSSFFYQEIFENDDCQGFPVEIESGIPSSSCQQYTSGGFGAATSTAAQAFTDAVTTCNSDGSWTTTVYFDSTAKACATSGLQQTWNGASGNQCVTAAITLYGGAAPTKFSVKTYCTPNNQQVAPDNRGGLSVVSASVSQSKDCAAGSATRSYLASGGACLGLALPVFGSGSGLIVCDSSSVSSNWSLSLWSADSATNLNCQGAPLAVIQGSNTQCISIFGALYTSVNCGILPSYYSQFPSGPTQSPTGNPIISGATTLQSSWLLFATIIQLIFLLSSHFQFAVAFS